jgi:glycerol kinase
VDGRSGSLPSRPTSKEVPITADLILALDQGTTSSRAALVDPGGRRIAEQQLAHRQHHPRPGLVEHDPVELLQAIAACARNVLAEVEPDRIAGVAITNQRETIVVWERRSGLPIANAIVWQDTRTADRCADLVASGSEHLVRERTGLPIQPYFSATKLGWLLDDLPGARDRAARGELAAGTIECWLAWNLTGGADGGAHISDVSNASRTLLLDTETLAWSDDLLVLFDVPGAVLPVVVPTWQPGGVAMTRADGPLGVALPLLATIGDQQAALVGQACLAAGEAKCTYGTGAFLLVNTGTTRPAPGPTLLASPAYQAADTAAVFCVEGAMAVAGRAIAWLADELGTLSSAAASEAVASSVENSGGVRVVPAFQGLYAPWWDPTARGAILGLTLHSTGAHIVRATLESLAFQTLAVVDAAEAGTGVAIPSLRIDGGATANRVLVQAVADALGRPVERAVDAEATVRGAAFSAGLAAGLWESPEALRDLRGPVEVVEPSWNADRREEEYADWLRAVERARGWA